MGLRLFLTLLLFLSASAFSTDEEPSREILAAQGLHIDAPHVVVDPEIEPFLREFESFVSRRKSREGFPAVAIAIVKDGQPVFLKTLGQRNTKEKQAANRHTVFRLASVSKGFAPILTGIMVERGLLSWDDCVVQYLPDFRLKDSLHAQAITIRHVLSMTTGLPRHAYSNLLDAGVPFPKIVEQLQDVAPSHAPGTFYNYQNVAYSLIGTILEKVSGKTYDQLLEEYLFVPLEMKDASATFEAIAGNENVAMPHVRTRGGYRQIKLSSRYYDAGPAAGVNASAVDMTRWLQFLLGNRPDVVRPATLDEVFTPRIHSSLYDKVLVNWRRSVNRAHYAMGWRVMQRPEGDIVYHGGYVNGYRAEVALFRTDGLGIAVLTNSTNPFISDCLPEFFDRYFTYRKKKNAEERQLPELKPQRPEFIVD